MDLSALRTFIDVAKQGSFASVARDHGVTPSSVSRTIAALEAELGVRLFQRTTRKLVPTEAGEAFGRSVEPVLDELDRAQLMAKDFGARPMGAVRVVAPVTCGQLIIVPLLPEFTRQYPDLSVELRLDDNEQDLLAAQVDVSLRCGRPPASEFVATRLCRVDFVACASRSYVLEHGRPRAPWDVLNHRCIVLSLPGQAARWRFRCPDERVVDVPVRGKVSITDAWGILQCTLGGIGISLLPRLLVEDHLHRGELVDIFPDHEITPADLDSAAWILYPSRNYLPLKVRIFVDFIKQHCVSQFRDRLVPTRELNGLLASNANP
ncbi:MAG: LysR family transcriptional regulator [Myxococcota bacterium]